jgi:hypothetical protein
MSANNKVKSDYETNLEQKLSVASKFDVVSKLSLSTIKAILEERHTKVFRKFQDVVDEEAVKKYAHQISLLDISKLLTFLMAQENVKKRNIFDATTYLSENIVSFKVGGDEMTFVKQDDTEVTVKTTRGVMGGMSTESFIATADMVAVKVSATKKNKVATFHNENTYAPSTAHTNYASETMTHDQFTHQTLLEHDMYIKNMKPHLKEGLLELYETYIPYTPIGKDENGKTKMAPIVKIENGQAKFSAPVAKTLKVRAEYNLALKEMQKYRQGINLPALKRLGRNMWTGNPIDAAQIDHVIALHEAKVPVDSSIFVYTSDSNLVSLLRANFGKQVYGMGGSSVKGMLTIKKIKSSSFDYVYYPVPMKCGSASTFSGSVANAIESIAKKYPLDVIGYPIFHMDPLLLYCKEINDLMEHKYDEFDKVMPIENIVEDRVCVASTFLATTEKEFAEVQPRKRDDKATSNVFTQIMALEGEFTMMYAQQLYNTKTKFIVSPLTYKGVVMHSVSASELFRSTLGSAIVYMREVFKSIWSMRAYSKNKYCINRFFKKALVGNIDYSDGWSAMYDPAVQYEAEAEEQKRIVNDAEYGAQDDEDDDEDVYEEEKVQEVEDF